MKKRNNEIQEKKSQVLVACFLVKIFADAKKPQTMAKCKKKHRLDLKLRHMSKEKGGRCIENKKVLM